MFNHTELNPTGLAHPPLQAITAEALYYEKIEQLTPIAGDVLFRGLTILGGRPKEGKSWLVLQLALGIAGETTVAGLPVHEPGRVVYCALEEPKRRTQARIKKLTQATDFLGDISLIYDIEPMTKGGLGQLDRYLAQNPATVVVIDTYMAFLRDENSKRDIVQADYNNINSLRMLAEKHDCAMVLVAHTRKAEGSAVDSLLGTTGISAACDCIWQLQKGQQKGEAVLNITGREVEAQSLALQFSSDETDFGWRFTGASGEQVGLSPERRAILDLLAADSPLTPKETAARLNKNDSTTRRLLQSLSQSGLVEKSGGGYQLVQCSSAYQA